MKKNIPRYLEPNLKLAFMSFSFIACLITELKVFVLFIGGDFFGRIILD